MTVRDGPRTVDVLYLGSRRADLALLVACWIVVAHEEGALIDLAADVSHLHGANVLFSKFSKRLAGSGHHLRKSTISPPLSAGLV
jgi:hypothetical protein